MDFLHLTKSAQPALFSPVTNEPIRSFTVYSQWTHHREEGRVLGAGVVVVMCQWRVTGQCDKNHIDNVLNFDTESQSESAIFNFTKQTHK